MLPTSRPKRRHHHVWQAYLKAWTTEGSIHCLQNGRIFRTGTRTVAIENDFYKLRRPTHDDVALLKMLFGSGHPAAVASHARLLNLLAGPFGFSRWLDAGSDGGFAAAALDRYASEVLEDHHARIEASFIPLLERALRGDVGFYVDDVQCAVFLHYLSTQYMRTRGIRDRAIEAMPGLENIWNVAVLMSATNIGASLFLERRRRRLMLVANTSDTPFITGDQPAINLKSSRPHPPEHLSIFYPVSPGAALILTDVDENPVYPEVGLTCDQARTLNSLVHRASHRQAFAQTAESLQQLTRVD